MMKKNLLLLFFVFMNINFAQNFNITEQTLKNGLKILYYEDHSVPNVCFYIYFKAGAKNERPGITGISHLFEHMMFNGSAKYPPGDFDVILEENGGYSNGSTWNDFTNYWEEFNPDVLEKVLDMESDRMKALDINEKNLEQERGIVMEERRMSVDNDPQSSMYEMLYAHAFVAHPYKWPVIGWMNDIKNIKLKDAQNYFKTYYAPNNAIIILTGAFNTEDAKKLMVKYFEDIPAQTPPDKVVNSEPEQTGLKKVILKRDVLLPAFSLGFKSVAYSDNDFCALDLLADILSSGKSSRLHNILVDKKQMVIEAYASCDQMEHPGLFTIYAQVREKVNPEKVRKEIFSILDDIKTKGISAEELEKVKNAKIRELLSKFKTNQRIGFSLGYSEVMLGDYRAIFELPNKYRAVSADDIKRVAKKYLIEDKCTEILLQPNN